MLPGKLLNIINQRKTNILHFFHYLFYGHFVQWLDWYRWVFFSVFKQNNNPIIFKRRFDIFHNFVRVFKLVINVHQQKEIKGAFWKIGRFSFAKNIFNVCNIFFSSARHLFQAFLVEHQQHKQRCIVLLILK